MIQLVVHSLYIHVYLVITRRVGLQHKNNSCFYFISFFVFWLHRVLVAAHGIFVEARELSSCGTQT